VFSPGRSSLSWPTSTHGAASPELGARRPSVSGWHEDPVTKEKPGFWTRQRAFEQVRCGSNIQLLSFSLVSALDVVRPAAQLCAKAASDRRYAGQRADRASRRSESVERFPNGKVLSSPLRPCEGKGPAAFPLVRGGMVGATEFEPVTSSVSNPTSRAGHEHRTVRDRAGSAKSRR
jgi:hypothetical protein